MAIEFRCSQCNQLLRVSDQSAGKSARCPKCQTTLKVPGTPPAATPPAAPQPAAPQPTGPAPTGGDDPFGFMDSPGGVGSSGGVSQPFGSTPLAGGGGFGGGAPPKSDPFAPSGFGGAASSNPFGESKPAGTATLGMNPYASPSAASFAPGMMPSQYGDRVGLPWEQSPSLGTWWQTAKLVMGSPQTAYRMMRQYGGMGSPILYTMTGLGIGGIGQALWQVAFSVLLIMGAGQAQDAMGMFAIQLISGIIGVVFGVLIGATLGLLIAAAISHLFLMMVGGAARGFEVTLRVIGFANGSLGWLNWIPYLGPLVSFFWMMYLEVVGFTEAHEIPTQKAVWAVVLQFLICFLLPMIVVGVLIAGALAAALSQQ